MSVNRKLNRLMWMERARTALIIAVVGIPLAIGISMIMVSQSGVNNRDGEPVIGVLLHHSSDYRDDGSIRATLRVELEDGEEVTVRTRNKGYPAVGEKIVLMKRLRENGRAFYYLPLVNTADK
ncbi:hypothetical protein [Roseibium sp.]|uniref:hypothetical protein n=1 Tax=Roseibium sp. TaxID=1936156 RepID=UPI003B5072B1